MSLQRLLILAFVGFLAQLVDGALGMGYGMASSTLLMASGIAPASASASVHLAEIGANLASGISHWKLGNVEWRTVRWIALPGGIGAFGGAWTLSVILPGLAKPIVAGFLFALGIYVLIRFIVMNGARPRVEKPLPPAFLVPLGAFAGFMDAFIGGGWGPITTPTLLAANRHEPRKVVGTVDTAEFVISAMASLGFLFALKNQGINLGIVAALLVGGVLAATVAAMLVRNLPPKVLGIGLGGMILLYNGRTLFNAGADVLKQNGTILPEGLGYVVAAAFGVVWLMGLVWAWQETKRDAATVLPQVEAV